MTTSKMELDVVKLFGKDRAQEDENLKHYFVKTSQYSEIVNGGRSLVLGRKGAGKSAIFQMLAEEKMNSDQIPVKISFDGEDFVFIQNALDANSISELVNDDFKYSLAWKDFIISEIIYAALKCVDKLDGVLKKFLSEKGLIREKTWEKFAHSLIKVIKGAKLQSTSGEIEFDFTGFSDLLEADKIKLRDSINDLIRKNKFVILIDNLDEPWKNSPDMNSWLRGLFFAIKQLKREFNNLIVVSFLRTDIFDIISEENDLFDSKSEITTISWDDDDYYNLKLLVATRISYYYKKPTPKTLNDIYNMWEIIFPPILHYGYQHSLRLPDYLIDRTFRRPRELLQFCRQIVSESKSHNFPVEENAISPAEIVYSNWKLNDLSGEYSKSYTNIKKCILSFVGAQKTWDWPCPRIESHLDSCGDEIKIFDCSRNSICSARDCIEILYRIGFLRKVRKERRTRYKMYYQDPNINYQTTVFDIHPAFRKKFVQ